MNSRTTTTAETANEEFTNMVNLLAVYSEAENRLEELQARVNEEVLELVDSHKADYAQAQQAITAAEAALEVIARAHPGWFKARKTLKTPYGEISLKTNPPKLTVSNEELSILLLQNEGEKNPAFKTADFLRAQIELNLETLANLSDEDLLRFKIRRVQGDTFTVKAAKLDLGKAVKTSAATEGKPENN